MIALGNRAHIVAHPSVKERLALCFSTILGCGTPVSFTVPGLREPILAFRFPHGGSISVEFSEKALDEEQARRGAWLEIRADDPVALTRRVLDADLPRIEYIATNTFYFVIPGGQVIGIVPARVDPGAGELRSSISATR